MAKRKHNAKRYKTGKSKGRLIVTPKHDKGNDRAKAKHEYWNAQRWQGGGHAQHCMDPVGLLWLTGHLDGHDVPGDELVEAFKLFEALRRTKYGCPTAQAIDYTPKTRTTGSDDGNVSGVSLFNRVDEILSADYTAWQAIQSLMFDAPFCQDTADQVPHWVQRLIDEAKLQQGDKLGAAILPAKIDRDRLDSAVRGLSLIVAAMGGRIKRSKAA